MVTDMPDRLINFQKHPKAAAYFVLFLATLLVATLIYSIVQGQRVAELQGQADSDKRTKHLACVEAKPKTDALLNGLIDILSAQAVSTAQLLKTTDPKSSAYKTRQAQVANYTAGISYLQGLKNVPCS